MSMASYRKRPLVIEAVRVLATAFDGTKFDGSPFTEIPDWLGEALKSGKVRIAKASFSYAIWTVHTPEGAMTARPGDWIVRGIRGELYPCEPGVFAESYEAAEPEG
jgi:hypothetical protein